MVEKNTWLVNRNTDLFSFDDYDPENRSVLHWHIIRHTHEWRPPTDVFETEKEVVVRVEIAGMRENDFSISLQDRRLVIRGSRQDEPGVRAFQQMEIHFGEFMIEVELPCSVMAEQASAEYEDGFLKLVLPKEKPQRIWIGK